MLDFTELFDAKIQASYWRELDPQAKEQFIGQQFFPVQKEMGLELSWIKGYNDYSVVLQPSAFDAQAPYRDRRGMAKVITEMPFFRERMRIGEKEKQKLRTLLVNGKEVASSLIARLYNDNMTLVNGALAQNERMRMSLLADAKIKVVSGDATGDNLVYEYNYDPTGEWHSLNVKKLASSKQWTEANKASSKPLQDILDFIIYLRNKRNVHPTKLLMNLQTFLNMINSESIVKAMNPLANTNLFITPPKAKAYIQDQLGVEIIVYDKNYKDENKVIRKYYPDGYITFLPDFPVGNTWFGLTPEEGDLMAQANKNASVAVVETGIAITTMPIVHPVNIETIVSEICLPSFERIEDTAVLKVF